MDPEIMAAERAFRGTSVAGKQVRDRVSDIDAAGPALLGVLNAFFRSVVERPFAGEESAREAQDHLVELRRRNPAEPPVPETAPMALFVVEQLDPKRLPSGRSRLPINDGVISQLGLIAEYTAKREGIVGAELERCIAGSCTRYLSGTY